MRDLATTQSDLLGYWRRRWSVWILERVLTLTWVFLTWNQSSWLCIGLPLVYWYFTNYYYLSPINFTSRESTKWQIPKGWYKVADSFDVPVEKIKSFRIAGQEVVLFRTSSGSVTVADAFCPHLGANLGVGSKVKGDCIECPFHGWRFSGKDGKCSSVPYSKNTPSHTSLRLWHTREVNSTILVWYTPDTENNEPEWEPSVIDALGGFHGKTEHFVTCRLQDIPENGADVYHLGFLHSPYLLRWVPFLSHGFSAEWSASKEPEQKHISQIKLQTWLNWRGNCMEWSIVNVSIRQIGPGLVYLHYQPKMMPWAHATVLQSATPVTPSLNKLQHVVYGSTWMPRWVTQIMLLTTVWQVDRDAQIWNNKTFRANPILVREEKSLKEYRRWFRQFYSQNLHHPQHPHSPQGPKGDGEVF